jgi:hypothetical protein
MAVFMSSCGQTYELQSITISPTAVSLEGGGAQQAFVVTANYSNTKTNVVTVKSAYQIGVPADEATNPLYNQASLKLNQSGIVEVVGVTCTWTTTPVNTGTTTTYSYGTDPYVLTATYTEGSKTVTAIALLSVNNAAGVCYDPTNPHP